MPQKGLRTLALVSGIVTLFLFHRPITRSAFTLFLCTRIYDSWWLAGDLDTACYDGAHSRWMWGIGVPTLLVYSLGVPLAVALLIRRAHHARGLDSESVRSRFGFLYNGYRPRFYYWESIIM